MIIPRTLATFVLLAASISLACADEIQHYEYSARDLKELSIESSVGEIIIEPSDNDTITVELTIKPNTRMGWFRRDPDLSAMQIVDRVRGDELRLRFDEKDVSAHWLIKMPDLDYTSIDLGVGVIEITDIRSEFNIDVGVGSVDIETDNANTGHVELAAGVGDTYISAKNKTDSRRALVSSESSAQGDGSDDIRVDVGVGDVNVVLR
ncbi:hypothetical protein [Pseudohongiella spirulinae]|uniref:Adhesin domain-containing protein n=1 Tax=Pseudohongiella spirulinae TaxID=1249552 RepID=A0A0S2KFL6_9GAMM|nr:hypothetical protein [Pseudohongiella spirulinae]ALO47117.1 hypothetical protein PS2015_2483 [Pseudohongiella spirulinae]